MLINSKKIKKIYSLKNREKKREKKWKGTKERE